MVFNYFMIKADYQQDDYKASLKRLLSDETAAKIGEAGLLNSAELNSLGMVAMTARSEIPESHRQIANSYIFKKQFFGSPVVQGQISREENELLMRYDLNRLEYSSIGQICEEIAFLQRQTLSLNATNRNDAKKILEIRAKELTFITASRYSKVKNEIFTGYKAVEKYFELISTYSKPYKNY